MKYYPLECVDQMKVSEKPEQILKSMKSQKLCTEDATVEDFYNYTFGFKFFDPSYNGKFKAWNDQIIANREINKAYFPMYTMKQIQERQTEWKDVMSISQTLNKWSQFKMVYKIDNDFYHEIKNTENLVTSYDTFKNLPFDCFFIDLTEVENISDFKGVFVNIKKDSCEEFNNMIGVNIYMVRGNDFTFFTYYSWYNFDEGGEVKWSQKDLPTSDFVVRKIGMTEDGMPDTYFRSPNDEYVDIADYDPRNDIVTAVFQIMTFIAHDASDISENENTKKTYKPHKHGSVIKNKFSEIRMWDVGVRYGKAIRLAKKEYKERIAKEHDESDELKERKPVRPHIRRAHWHKFRVGEGRKEIKTLWLAPTYVCGNGKEIPVTIREIKK